jgi:predicted nucleic-acid-binding protein
MKALDTNVPARLFIDDPDDAQAALQRPAAIAALSDREFVPVTVLLEFEWPMRGFYALPARDVSRVLRALAGIEHVLPEDRDAVLSALEAFDKGLDFAGALHVQRSARASGFLSFDRRLVQRAKRWVCCRPWNGCAEASGPQFHRQRRIQHPFRHRAVVHRHVVVADQRQRQRVHRRRDAAAAAEAAQAQAAAPSRPSQGGQGERRR